MSRARRFLIATVLAATVAGTLAGVRLRAADVKVVDPTTVVMIVNRDSNEIAFMDIKSKKIVGKTLASEPAPKAGAIPWLLLSTEPSGSGLLAGVRYVQRVNTSGGVGPSGACPTVEAEQRVAYTADYVFYR